MSFLGGTPVTGPRSLSQGVTQSQVGVPQSQAGGTPIRGTPWPGQEEAPHQSGQDGVPPTLGQDTLGQIMPGTVWLLQFPVGGLSCCVNIISSVYCEQN